MDWPVCKLQVCNLVFNEFAQAEKQKVNKHSKFNANFDIRLQLEHYKYEVNSTLVNWITLDIPGRNKYRNGQKTME